MRDIHRRRQAAHRHTPQQAARRSDRLITLWSHLATRLEHADSIRERRRLIHRLWRVTLEWRSYEVDKREAIYHPRPDSRAQWELRS